MIPEFTEQDPFLRKKIEDLDCLAGIITSSLFPPEQLFQELFSEHFIFYKPKYLSGGDFYWLTAKDSTIYIAVGDATGHEIHGALISILGMYFLNQIVLKAGVEYTDEILNLLREKMIQCFQSNFEKSLIKESIDISLCKIDLNKMEAQFTGAYNSLYVVSNNNLEVYRADRITAGYSEKGGAFFTTQNFNINHGDTFYLFTDGYSDQFGGENHKKFMVKRFNHLLLNIYQYPMDKQKEWLEKTLTDWMLDSVQVDDITVIGFKI